MKKLFFVFTVFIFALLLGCTQPIIKENKFLEVEGNSICMQDEKPVIRMYSTTWCPHCVWAGPAFEEVALKYQREGKIIAKHWELDVGDDTLTPELEGSVPANEQGIFSQFSPDGSVPVYVFGCKYYRIANQFESQKDLNAEKAEFERIINLLLEQN